MVLVLAPVQAAEPDPGPGISLPREVVEVGHTLRASVVPASRGSWGVVHEDVLRVDAGGVITGLRRGGTYVTWQAPDGSGVAAYVRVVRAGEGSRRWEWEAPPNTVHRTTWFTAPVPEGASGPFGAPPGWEDPMPMGVWVDDFVGWRVSAVTGPLALDAAQAALEDRATLQLCYRGLLGPGGVGEDHGALELVVGPGGRPEHPTWSALTRDEPSFHRCLDLAARALRFPEGAAGARVTISADFVLRP